MEKATVLTTLALENQLSLILTDCQSKHMRFEDIVETLTLDECREIILASIVTSKTKPITLDDIVKKVIDEFDLYVLLPGIDAPHSEYDHESHCIAKNIIHGMSAKDIANVIKEVFDEWFDAGNNVSFYMDPAEQIHTYLNHSYGDGTHTNNSHRCLVMNDKLN